MIVYNGSVIGYSDFKKVLKDFMEQFGIEDYTIIKVPEDDLPENIDTLIRDKEIYYDDFYGAYTSNDIMMDVSEYISAIADRYVEVDNFMDSFLEYVKLSPDERDDVTILSNDLHDAIMDLVGDEDTGASYYSDYFNVTEIMKELVTGNITITHMPF